MRNLFRILDEYGRRHAHGHVGTNDSRVDIDEDTVRGADVAYYREERWPRARVGHEPPPGPPDLAVEVVSSYDRPAQILEKVGDYLKAGVPMVWVLHPKRRTVSIYRSDDATPEVLCEGDTIENLEGFPGLRCAVAELFA